MEVFMRIRPNEITAPIDDSFDEEKLSESLKKYGAGIKPRRVVLFQVLAQNQDEIRRLVQIGADPAVIAKGFAPRLQVSAAKMKLFIDLRIKGRRQAKRPPKSPSPVSESERTAPSDSGEGSAAISPSAVLKATKIQRM
jgi:hypothetical protein